MNAKDLSALSERYKIWDELYWIPAFRILTLMWAQSFLPMMGLPRALVDEATLRFSIFQKVLHDYELYSNSLVSLQGDEFWWARRVLAITLIREALQKLEAALGEAIAADLEHWICHHFLSQKIRNALFDWAIIIRAILRASYSPIELEFQRIPPPASLAPLLPLLEELLYGAIDGSYYVLRWAMPSLSTGIVALAGSNQGLSADAGEIHRVISQELTLQMLQLIAKSLNCEEQQELLNWIEVQVQEGAVMSVSSHWEINKLLDLKNSNSSPPSLLKSTFPHYLGQKQ